MDPTRQAFAAEPSPAIVPGRFRQPLFRVVDDVLPDVHVAKLGLWLHEHRHMLTRGGDDAGELRFSYDLPKLDDMCPDLVAPLRRVLVDASANQSTLDALAIPAFDLRHIEFTATLYHQGSHMTWHDDVPGYDGEVVPSRRVTFAYYLHSEPKMFTGGELEFAEGTTIEPTNNRLALFHPVQQHRIRRVECWSAEAIHGRWAIMGWIHGDPPEGWLERLPTLRGVPSSG